MPRGNPFVDYPELMQLTDDLTALFSNERSAYDEAIALALTQNPWPPLHRLKGRTVILAPYSHLEPSTTAPALAGLVAETNADAVIFSGGRTGSEWEEGDSEARRLHARFNAVCSYGGSQMLETQSMNTSDNFVLSAEGFADEFTGADHVLVLMHDLQSQRGLMTARQAFCHTTGIMDEATFGKKVVACRYTSDIPAHDPNPPEQLAGIISRMRVYSRPTEQWAQQLRPTLRQAQTLENLCTRASEYASKGAYDRKRYA